MESLFSKLYQISLLVPNCQQINHLGKEVKIMVTWNADTISNIYHTRHSNKIGRFRDFQ